MPEQDWKFPITWSPYSQESQNNSDILQKLSYADSVHAMRPIDPSTGLYTEIKDITDAVNTGVMNYHPKKNKWLSPNGIYFRDPDTGRIYYDTNGGDQLNLSNVEILSDDAVAKLFPARDYIGGTADESRRMALSKMPEVQQYIKELGAAYGIDPNLLAHRFLREGYIDQQIALYNNHIPTAHQYDFWQSVPNQFVNGFHQLGLDDFSSNYDQGLYNLRRDLDFDLETNINEKGRTVNSANFNNLWDALEAKAADMEYRKKLAMKRGIPVDQMNAYINAMYNLGAHHKDLNNIEFILKNYGVGTYFKKGGKMPYYLKKFNYNIKNAIK